MKTTGITLITFCFILSMGSSHSAESRFESQRAWPIITFTCDKENNQLKIKNEVIWGDAGKNYVFDASQGTYNLWQLVKSEDRGTRRLLSESDRLKLSCRLGNTEYRVVVRPKIFNTNFFSRCGDRISAIISIYANEAILLDDKALEGYCFGNSPVIRGIKVNGESNKVKIYEVPRSRFY